MVPFRMVFCITYETVEEIVKIFNEYSFFEWLHEVLRGRGETSENRGAEKAVDFFPRDDCYQAF